MILFPVLPCAVVLACLSGSAGAQTDGDGYAFVELETDRDSYFLGETFAVRLRFGFDREYFETNGLPLYRQHLDVPVQLQAPWLGELAGAIALEPDPDPGDALERASFGLNDGRAEAPRVADRTVEGRPYSVFEIERSFAPDRPGELVLPGPTLRFAYATTFRDDVLSGRQPEDRREGSARGHALTLTVYELPEEGRPPGFSGAIGRFTVRADASPREVAAGESLKLVLTVEGEGNLPRIEPPRLDPIPGFRVYGALEDWREGRHSVTYDVAPLTAGVREVPPIPFPFFDPGPPAGYRTAHTDPIPLDVGPAIEVGGRSAPRVGDERTEPTPAGDGPSPTLIVGAVVLAGLLALWVSFRLRARARLRSDPDRVRASAAAAAFRTRVAGTDADVSEALVEYLAARLGCSSAAVIAPDLRNRIVASGVPLELALHSATLVERLIEARYGGQPPAESVRSAHSLVEALEEAFRARGAAK